MKGRNRLRIKWAYHRFLDRITGGRFRSDPFIGPTAWLRTTGRKSGVVRENALMCLRDDERFVVVAVNPGGEEDPAWLRNLKALPQTTIRIGRERWPVVARVASPDEAGKLWPRLDAIYPTFARYRAKSRRRIPVVILDPMGESTPATETAQPAPSASIGR